MEIMSIKATSLDWQRECLEQANAREDFVVEEYSEIHLPFFQKLCRKCNYRKFVIERGMLFLPGF